MKKLFLLLIFFLVTGHLFCQDIKRVKRVIDTLCSPSFYGRGYVGNGDGKTAKFLASKFSSIGLQHFNNSYFQHFSFPVNRFPGKVLLKVNHQKLIPGKDFTVDPASPPIKFKGQGCVLDTLIFSDSIAREKFLLEGCKGKILIYRAEDLNKIKELKDPYLKKFQSYQGYIELQKNKLTSSVSTQQSEKPTFQVLIERWPTHVEKIELDLDAEWKEHSTQNVAGFVPGAFEKDSLIVITAHYDHLGGLGKDVYFPGANDNASGVSMLLELADYFTKNPGTVDYGVVFIAFAGEEAGLLGSRYFTSYPLFSLDKIKFLINLDLVGTGDDGIAVVDATVYPREMEILEKLNSSHQYFSYIKKRGEAANSDHYFFYLKGVKSFFIYTLGGIQSYHDVDDRPETLPLTKYSELYNLLIEFIKAI